ncbi:TetR/AcrR family transcriptional regulator [Aquabacter sp. P-9]|uniref:TetR/AcrR family transcriptional regulator n=1 Tax=Aquabacter sediminis TaxID=3029197 RepID=UPI00237DFFBB|nr:TetR/AcrR family transcriptional regulator [Aquabacter sp. P-9]MDE1570105.1 TetR/AcrR family transcriptional regulator [Aquabacter sp. P-9]
MKAGNPQAAVAHSDAQRAMTGLDLSMEAMAARMLARHHATIRVKKPQVATARLARIVETTLTLANNAGFQSMSLRDLSEQSGLSMGALYAYFDSKETLLRMILGTVSTVVEEVLGAPPPDLDGPRAHLTWLLRTHVALTEAMLAWFTFSYMEAKTFPPEARAMAVASERRTEGFICDALAQGAAAGVFEIDDAAMTAALIKPMLQDWYVKRSKYRRRGIAPDAFADALVAFVERAILPHEPLPSTPA